MGTIRRIDLLSERTDVACDYGSPRSVAVAGDGDPRVPGMGMN
jgi:hypothetical protein